MAGGSPLKNLANRTRRGLRGRIEAGKSGGGNSYGYDVVRTIGDNGEPVRGERRINPQQAAIVKRIFSGYARAISPRAIAKQLNKEGVPGPSGKASGPSTIHGNWQRGTASSTTSCISTARCGTACASSRTPRPASGSRDSIPKSEWVTHEVPDLRLTAPDPGAAHPATGTGDVRDTCSPA